MSFGTSDHIFDIHDVQLIIIFISLTKIKDIVENLDELCFQCSCVSMFTQRRRLGHMFLTIPFNIFYYSALKYGNFLLETLDTFALLKGAYTQSRKLYENRISSWYGALQQILNNIPKLKQLSTNQKKFQNKHLKQSRKYFQKHIGINGPQIGTNVLMVN